MCMNMIVSCMLIIMCTYCICMYCLTMYSAVRIPLVSNCAIYIRFSINIIIINQSELVLSSVSHSYSM